MNRIATPKLWSAVVGLCLVTLGCRGSTALSTSAVTEPAGPHCATGGLAVRTGTDVDGDAVISESEAASTSYLCNGTAGAPGATGVTSLNKVTAEPAGANCTLGGSLLETGADTNGNATLEATEVTSSEYLCTPASTSTNLVLLSKTFIGAPDAACPGGYVRIGYGPDTNADGTLSAGEQTASFLSCNLAPRVTSSTTVIIADCTQSPIVVPLTSVDLDGRVAQTSVEVLASGSTLVFSSGPNGEIRLTPGAHVAGAGIAVTLTDDLGATAVVEVRLVFSGTGCSPQTAFHGVFPDTCIAIEIEPIVGDDRSGPVLTARGVYYNGDDGLMYAGLDLDGGTLLTGENVDCLMGDAVRGRLLSLYSSEWVAVLADGGAGITGLLDPAAGGRFRAFGSPEPLDQIAVLDETTFQPSARFALPQPFAATGQPQEFSVTGTDGGVVTITASSVIVSATDGQALVARAGTNTDGEHGVLYQLIDTATGAVTLNRELYFASGDTSFGVFQWRSQEDSVQHYALHKRGAQYVLTYLNTASWMELELAAGQPVPMSTSFATDCDVKNLSLGAALDVAYFHAEGGCFGFATSESLLRCSTLYGPNPNGAIDDRGTTARSGEVGKR
ncbi:MAG: hypothetical protein Q8K32_08230 [Archangium sp.]|nr:hypothetical protein [Archangium sp.]